MNNPGINQSDIRIIWTMY